MRTRPLPFIRFLVLFAGPAVWFAHLAVLYGAETMVCLTPARSSHVMAWTGALATLLALVSLALIARVHIRQWGDRAKQSAHPEFLDFVTLSLIALSALSIIWNALPVFLMRVCNASF